MDTRQLVKLSKFLSRHLRHAPEDLGLTLAEGGWVDVDALLAACQARGVDLDRAALEEVVRTSDKQRFAFDPSGRRIRANQGHSVAVDLQLEPATPPDMLYHGTAEPSVASILATGLQRQARHHVHLSLTAAVARDVGRRHGPPVILVVDAAGMARDGLSFYRSANGVWLTDEVPARYLRPL
jgi:putative RNA 2'-phosphotransferase